MLASAYTKMGYRKSKRSEETSDDAANGATGAEDQEEVREEDEEVVIVDHNVNAPGVGGERSTVAAAAAVSGTGNQASTDGPSAGSRSGWISWFGRSSKAKSSANAATDQGGGDKVDSHPESEAAKEEHVQVPEKGQSSKVHSGSACLSVKFPRLNFRLR